MITCRVSVWDNRDGTRTNVRACGRNPVNYRMFGASPTTEGGRLGTLEVQENKRPPAPLARCSPGASPTDKESTNA